MMKKRYSKVFLLNTDLVKSVFPLMYKYWIQNNYEFIFQLNHFKVPSNV